MVKAMPTEYVFQRILAETSLPAAENACRCFAPSSGAL